MNSSDDLSLKCTPTEVDILLQGFLVILINLSAQCGN